MDKRERRKRPKDVNQLAHQLVIESTHQAEIEAPTKAQISILMSQLGSKGGKIGGKRRLETLSSERRKQIAQKAAKARWNKK